MSFTAFFFNIIQCMVKSMIFVKAMKAMLFNFYYIDSVVFVSAHRYLKKEFLTSKCKNVKQDIN